MESLHARYKTLTFFLFVCLSLGILLTACQKDDDEAVPDGVQLLSFGPSPALRGDELRFIGHNLDQVTAIVLPQNVRLTSFDSQSSTELTITIPEETVNGLVVLETPAGNITSKSQLTISEPITISSFTPQEARPGDKITISGTYLNLVQSVIFSDNKIVGDTAFITHEQGKIELTIPLDAQSGPITVSNGAIDPIRVRSEQDLIVTLPVITEFAPSPIRPGAELTIVGTDLDLIQEVIFGGVNKVESFTSQSATELKLNVPDNAQDDVIKATVASLVEVSTENQLILVVPTITEMSPNPAKPGTDISLSGTDLDLVTSIVFGGDQQGAIVSKEQDKLVATVPLATTLDLITLNLASGKTVSSTVPLDLISPTISSLSPTEIKTNADLTITGTHLDLVVEIVFPGGVAVTPSSTTEDELIVTVPPGTENGEIILVTTNGSQITSTESLTILASNVPLITGFPEIAKPGSMIVLTGEKMDLLTDVIFPENVFATQFGLKTPTMIEVIVPEDVRRGLGVITFVTFEGETTTSPPINFQGVDSVQDPDLVFFDFNGSGAKDSWWGAVQIVNDDNSLDGSSYGMISGSFNGWTDLFWRNSNNNFPGAAIGTNVSDFVIKFDINVLEPITAGNLKMRLNTSENDFWWAIGPAAPGSDGSALAQTNGWVTVTVEISEFRDDFGWGSGSPTDLSDVPNEFGMAFDNGASVVNILIDNVRFERKQ